MTTSELEQLMTKIQAGIVGMNGVEFTYASKLYTAARDYRDYIKQVCKIEEEGEDEA